MPEHERRAAGPHLHQLAGAPVGGRVPLRRSICAGGLLRFTGTFSRCPLRRRRCPRAACAWRSLHPSPCCARSCARRGGRTARRYRASAPPLPAEVREHAPRRRPGTGTGGRAPGRAIHPPESAPRLVPRRASSPPERAARRRQTGDLCLNRSGRRPGQPGNSLRQVLAADRRRAVRSAQQLLGPGRGRRRRSAGARLHPDRDLRAEAPAVAGAAEGPVRESGRSAAAAGRRRLAWACRRPPSYRSGPGPDGRCPASGSCPPCGPTRPGPALTAPRARRVPAIPSAPAAPGSSRGRR